MLKEHLEKCENTCEWGDEKKDSLEILQGKIEMLEILIKDSWDLSLYGYKHEGWLKEDLEELLLELKSKLNIE